MIWVSAIFFESLTPALIQPSIGGLVGDDGGGDHRAEKVALAALVQAGVELEPVGMEHLVVPELRGHRDLGLERHRHELLRPLSGDDELAALVGRHVAVATLERIAGVGDVERLPSAPGEDRRGACSIWPSSSLSV